MTVHWGQPGAVLADFAALPAPDADLAAWAARIGTADGAFPLIGTGTRAETYPALLWNGARCARAGLGPAAGLTLIGLAVGAEHGRSAADLARAVAAGLDSEVPTSAPLHTGVIAATVTAARLAGVPDADLPALLDLAASLMVIGPPSTEPGHAPAAGWLALRARSAGIVGMHGGLAHTLAVVAGDPAPLDRAPADVAVGEILGTLR
ncbi:hypothetical protein AB0J74_27975 [Asanoa sp. NPDC049573]|uniref:hypothetical protein n=1 Tax=Asanoa sp. NPDC049573 TaxID=3155396 RepID=UPI00341A5230